MIRFVDLRGQGTGSKFTFYDTGIDQIRTFGGSTTWDSWDDFEADYHTTMGNLALAGRVTSNPAEFLNRLKSLCPEWVFKHSEHVATFHVFNADAVNLWELLNKAAEICETHNCDFDDLEVSVVIPEEHIVVSIPKTLSKGMVTKPD